MAEEATQRWKWTVAYDGATYEGWQSQPSGDTIQDALERALAEMNSMPTGIRVHGSGRTDAGVHADGQVCHVDTPARLHLDSQSWPRAMNARLPATVRILDAEPVSDAFHARFSVIRKTYRYQIFHGNILPPMLAKRAWRIHKHLDRNVLLQAARLLEGTHDFKAFAANRGPNCPPPRSTVRTIKRIEIVETPDNQWFLEFTADGFLYRMVRLLVGTMIKFAHGKLLENELKQLVYTPGPLKTSACAPAEGLYLSEVCYQGERVPK